VVKILPSGKKPGESSHERKRREILAAALDIFSAKGFEGTTLEAVADALGYTKPALYYYFDSKEALFRSLALESLREADARIAAIGASAKPAREKLREVIRMYLDDHFERRGYFSISHVLMSHKDKLLDGAEREEIDRLSSSIPRAIVGMLRQGVADGDFIAEDPEVLGGIVIAMLSGILIHIEMPALAGVDSERLKSRLDQIILKGISA
jgi:AcrR family transcriptional regulator